MTKEERDALDKRCEKHIEAALVSYNPALGINEGAETIRYIFSTFDTLEEDKEKAEAECDEARLLNEKQTNLIAHLTLEVERLRMPICVGEPLIRILAGQGGWQAEDGRGIVAADSLFGHDPYAERDEARRERDEAKAIVEIDDQDFYFFQLLMESKHLELDQAEEKIKEHITCLNPAVDLNKFTVQWQEQRNRVIAHKENTALRARVERLREGLRRFGSHPPGCKLCSGGMFSEGCDCGLSALLVDGEPAGEEGYSYSKGQHKPAREEGDMKNDEKDPHKRILLLQQKLERQKANITRLELEKGVLWQHVKYLRKLLDQARIRGEEIGPSGAKP